MLTAMQGEMFASVQSVSEITRHIRDLLMSDEPLRNLWVRGEVSNFSRSPRGHLYFNLKDAGASLRCVVWASATPRLGASLQDGIAVEAHGSIALYEPSGQYQLQVDRVRPAGEGALYAEFVRLKSALEAEGLFDNARKRPVPERPQRIAVVTSPTGAAIRDVLNTLRRRLPLAAVVIAPTLVQGADAPAQIVHAIDGINRLRPAPDVLLLVRGGGSAEDLWGFNNESVVRAVVASRIPVISGIGHETDFTLCDFASDLRAPTPTAAAELATPVTLAELGIQVRDLGDELAESISQMLATQTASIKDSRMALAYVSPVRRIATAQQSIDELARRLHGSQQHRLILGHEGLQSLAARLASLSPLAILARGYAVVTRAADGKVVRVVRDARDELKIRVSDGIVDARVNRGTS